MKKSLLLLISVYGLCLLSACGGSGGSTVQAPATHFSVSAPASATAGTAFQITVTALDAANDVATSYSGTVHFTSTDAQAVLPANSMLTNGNGTFSATLKIGGGQTITATDTVTASITGTSNSINVTASHFSVSAPASASVGMAFNFTVTALDAANNVATSYSGTVHFTSTDAQAVLPANSMLTNGNGTFSATLNTAGGQKITATDTVVASITGTSNAITVFSGCTAIGGICGPQFAPCCEGKCVNLAGGSRCELEGNAEAFRESSRFTGACTMATARESHTATLLSNGLVLIAGGDDKTASLATAELFNPESHSFAPVGDMANARARHTATLLPNGAVLVIGGRDTDGNALATAELFNPADVSFAPTVSMITARESHTATLLSSGKVLITGGDNGKVSLATAELFDPNNMSFTPADSMGAPRSFQTATLLKNGKVLLAGGRDAEGNVLATAELFDPTIGRFTPAGTMQEARESHAATLLSDGSVLITGGDNGKVSLATAELFDPTSGKFTPAGAMSEAREFHTATLRSDGTVLVAGGTHFPVLADSSSGIAVVPGSSATAELFDPASGSFKPAGYMVSARSRHTATLLADRTVVLIGGADDQIMAGHIAASEILATAELFQ